MEKKKESTIVYWGYIGMMEKKMETTISCLGQLWVDPCEELTQNANDSGVAPENWGLGFRV